MLRSLLTNMDMDIHLDHQWEAEGAPQVAAQLSHRPWLGQASRLFYRPSSRMVARGTQGYFTGHCPKEGLLDPGLFYRPRIILQIWNTCSWITTFYTLKNIGLEQSISLFVQAEVLVFRTVAVLHAIIINHITCNVRSESEVLKVDNIFSFCTQYPSSFLTHLFLWVWKIQNYWPIWLSLISNSKIWFKTSVYHKQYFVLLFNFYSVKQYLLHFFFYYFPLVYTFRLLQV